MRHLTLGLCVVLAVGAPAAQRPQATSARVVDATTQAALPRVRVAVVTPVGRSEAVFTDDEGVFTLQTVPADTTIRFSKAGYATARVSPAQLTSIVRLPRAASISGRVLETKGAPVADAQVRLRRVTPAASAEAGDQTAETNDLGEYRFGGLQEDRYELTVVRPSLTPPRTVTAAAGEDVAGVDVMVPVASCSADAVDSGARRSSARAAISGRITSTAGVPLACAEVRAARVGEPLHVTSSDNDGRFALSGLSPGAYRVEARAAGYGSREYGQRRAGQSGVVLTLGDGEHLARIDMTLSRGSAILGTVVDEHGEPLESVTVRALHLRSLDGRTVGVKLAGVVTDDRGQYRLSGLLPGRYLVSAVEEAVLLGGTAAAGYAPTFYPGATEVVDATPVLVDGEHDRAGTDLVYRPVAAVQVRGSATSTMGTPADAVILMVSQRSGGIMVEPRAGEVKADGTFAISNVPPGDYVLQAVSRRQGSPAEFGMEYLTVNEASPAPVMIRTRPMSTVSGRILLEGQGAAASDFALAPFPTDYDRSFAVGGGFPMARGRDGTFRMGSVTGPRRLTLLGGPDGWYLKSAMLNGVDVADSPFDFGLEGQAHDGLEIVVSSQGAGLAGDVVDGSNRRVRNYAVVVFSTQPDLWFRNSRHVKFTRSDQDDRFSVDGLPPGTYWAAALQEIDGNAASGEWQDPRVLEALASEARRVELREGEHVAATLRLSTR